MSNQLYRNSTAKYHNCAHYEIPSSQALANGTSTILNINEVFNGIQDLDYDPATHIFTIKKDMILLINYQVEFAAHVDNGQRAAWIQWLGTQFGRTSIRNASSDAVNTIISGSMVLDTRKAQILSSPLPETFIFYGAQVSTVPLATVPANTRLRIVRMG